MQWCLGDQVLSIAWYVDVSFDFLWFKITVCFAGSQLIFEIGISMVLCVTINFLLLP